MKKIKAFFALIRVKHYLKNGLIFLPLFFAVKLTDVGLLLRTLAGFAAFCLAASLIYIVNDIRDIEKDRQHSTKCNRPLPSGAISVGAAIAIAAVFGLGAIAILIALKSWAAGIILALYVALNFGYSFGLKNVPVLDLVILASGFVLRVLFGGAVSGIEVSNWLLLVMAAGALYMGMGKRRGELRREGEGTRAVNKYYSVGFLDRNMYLCLALTIAFYSLWCLTSSTIGDFANGDSVIWSVIVLLVLVIRYNYVIEGDSDGDPVSVITRDPMLLILAALYVIYMGLVVYVPFGG